MVLRVLLLRAASHRSSRLLTRSWCCPCPTLTAPPCARPPRPQEAVEIINSCFPEEVVRYYSPSYSKQLLEKLDAAAGLATGSAVAVA